MLAERKKYNGGRKLKLCLCPNNNPAPSTVNFAPPLFPVPSSKPSPAPSAEPSMQPTFPCNNITPEERQLQIRDILAKVTDETLLDDIETPQGSAFDWIVNHDALYTCPGEVKPLVQRYVLATLYYSTKGDNWTYCNADPASKCPEGMPKAVKLSNDWECDAMSTRWLDASHECSWCGVRCDDDWNATEIDIGKLFDV